MFIIPPNLGLINMKLLFIHSDYMEYQATKEALKDGYEPISDDQKSGRLDEVLTVFTSVE